MNRQRYIVALLAIYVSFSMLTIAPAQAAPVLGTQILLNSGGDSVAVSGEWGFVGDADACEVNVYRYNYATNLWGDGAGADGVPFQTIAPGPCNKAENRSFAASISASQGLLVVGAPLAKSGQPEHGRIFFFRFNGTTWEQLAATGNPEDPAGVPDLQDGARFGQKVSVRTQLTGTNSLVLVGSPLYDEPGVGVDAGKVYLYDWDGTNLTYLEARPGLQAGAETGTAVTSNGIEFLAGAPGLDVNGIVDSGGVYLLRQGDGGAAARLYTAESLGATAPTAGDRLGTELSLGSFSTPDTIALFSGRNSYVLSLDIDNELVLEEELVNTNNGDVSQSGSLAGFGYVGNKTAVFLDKTNVVADSEDVTFLPPTEDTSYGRDINLGAGRLLVNGDALNQAYSYYGICGNGGFLNALEWTMIGTECDTGTLSIAELFGSSLGAYGTDWIMTRQADGNFAGTVSAYQTMGATETLEQGRGYWIISATDTTWEFDANVLSTLPTATPTVPDPLSRPEVVGVFNYTLNSVVAGTGRPDGQADKRVMLANPFPAAIQWPAATLTGCPTGALDTVANNPDCFQDRDTNAYVYNAASGGYVAISSTPGFQRAIEPGEGFYVRFSADLNASVPNRTLGIAREAL